MSGFQPFEVVEIWLYSTPMLLGTLTADADGVISGSFTVPSGTPAGTHHIVLFDEAETQYTSVDLTVAAYGAARRHPSLRARSATESGRAWVRESILTGFEPTPPGPAKIRTGEAPLTGARTGLTGAAPTKTRLRAATVATWLLVLASIVLLPDAFVRWFLPKDLLAAAAVTVASVAVARGRLPRAFVLASLGAGLLALVAVLLSAAPGAQLWGRWPPAGNSRRPTRRSITRSPCDRGTPILRASRRSRSRPPATPQGLRRTPPVRLRQRVPRRTMQQPMPASSPSSGPGGLARDCRARSRPNGR